MSVHFDPFFHGFDGWGVASVSQFYMALVIHGIGSWEKIASCVEGRCANDCKKYYEKYYRARLRKKYGKPITMKIILEEHGKENYGFVFSKLSLSSSVNVSDNDNKPNFYNVKSIFSAYLKKISGICDYLPRSMSIFPQEEVSSFKSDPFNFYSNNMERYYFYNERSKSHFQNSWMKRPPLMDALGRNLVSPEDDLDCRQGMNSTQGDPPRPRQRKRSGCVGSPPYPENSPSIDQFGTFPKNSIDDDINLGDNNSNNNSSISSPTSPSQQSNKKRLPSLIFDRSRNTVQPPPGFEDRVEQKLRFYASKSRNGNNVQVNNTNEKNNNFTSSPTKNQNEEEEEEEEIQNNQNTNNYNYYGYFPLPPSPQKFIQTEPNGNFEPLTTHDDYCRFVKYHREGGGISKPYISTNRFSQEEQQYQCQQQQQIENNFLKNRIKKKKKKKDEKNRRRKGTEFEEGLEVRVISKERRRMIDEDDEEENEENEENDDDEEEEEEDSQQQTSSPYNNCCHYFVHNYSYVPYSPCYYNLNEQEIRRQRFMKHRQSYLQNEQYRNLVNTFSSLRNMEDEETSRWEQKTMKNWSSKKNDDQEKQQNITNSPPPPPPPIFDDSDSREWEESNGWGGEMGFVEPEYDCNQLEELNNNNSNNVELLEEEEEDSPPQRRRRRSGGVKQSKKKNVIKSRKKSRRRKRR